MEFERNNEIQKLFFNLIGIVSLLDESEQIELVIPGEQYDDRTTLTPQLLAKYALFAVDSVSIRNEKLSVRIRKK